MLTFEPNYIGRLSEIDLNDFRGLLADVDTPDERYAALNEFHHGTGEHFMQIYNVLDQGVLRNPESLYHKCSDSLREAPDQLQAFLCNPDSDVETETIRDMLVHSFDEIQRGGGQRLNLSGIFRYDPYNAARHCHALSDLD